MKSTDKTYKLFLQRAENEIKLATIIISLSEKEKIQTETFGIARPETYYSAVISHSYYAIFYCAKAYLKKHKVHTYPPNEHNKVYEEFEKFVILGDIQEKLLEMYTDARLKADELLDILQEEKIKRGKFTYHKLPQANKTPSKNSLERAKFFFKIIYNLLNET